MRKQEQLSLAVPPLENFELANASMVTEFGQKPTEKEQITYWRNKKPFCQCKHEMYLIMSS